MPNQVDIATWNSYIYFHAKRSSDPDYDRFLDTSLVLPKSKVSFLATKDDIPDFSQNDRHLLVRALKRLEKDGYVDSSTEKFPSGNTATTFKISFDGLLALEQHNDQPYRSEVRKEQLLRWWNNGKIVAVAVNAIVTLAFIILTYVNDK